jgi:signal transduction histidine kinase
LSAVAFAVVGISYPAVTAAAVVGAMAIFSLVPASRHLVHVALGLVALAGIVVAASGVVALARGELATPLVPSGAFWPVDALAGGMLVQAATTVLLLCLAAVCLPTVIPATSQSRAAAGAQTDRGDRAARASVKWAVRAAVGTSIVCWAFVIPALLRVAGLSLPSLVAQGRTGALSSAFAGTLVPLAGAHAAASLAHWLVCVTCLAGAFGALTGGTGLAETALGAARAARAGRHGPMRGVPGASHRQSPNRVVPFGTVIGVAITSGLGAAGVADLGPRDWLVVALGGLATGALALVTLAPPVVRQCQRIPAVVRVCVGGIWAITVTAALGSAGPSALAINGLAALGGAFAIGWRGQAGHRDWRSRRVALPWSTAAAALVTTSAVTTLEVLPNGTGTASTWRGLAVLVMGAGVVVLAVFPATSRLRVEHLGDSASTLADRALPALVRALETLASGNGCRLPTTELSELKASTRPLEAELATFGESDEMLEVTKALVEASKQVQRLATAIEAVARLDSRRLEELVEERTAMLSSANRNLVDSQWRRRQLLDRTVRVAEGERARIAANLHDGPIQRLSALGLILDRCRLRLDRDDKTGARELVKRARTELSDEIHNLRQMMSELRPPILDEGGLEAAVRDQLSGWSVATGIGARFDASPHTGLSPNSETVIYRVVQESLANVAKHARASHVVVTLEPSGNGVQVVVRDNGRGFRTLSQPDLLRGGHFGLVVMRERVELAAGKFDIQSAPLNGTAVSVWLPTASSEAA